MTNWVFHVVDIARVDANEAPDEIKTEDERRQGKQDCNSGNGYPDGLADDAGHYRQSTPRLGKLKVTVETRPLHVLTAGH